MGAEKQIMILNVTPGDCLVGTTVEIVVSGLNPGDRVRISATVSDGRKRVWASWGDFAADGRGLVDPGQCAPLAGTYAGVDGTGLFWSMLPPADGSFEMFAMPVDKPVVFDIEARTPEGMSCRASLRLRAADADVRRIVVDHEGLEGLLFLPATGKVLGGVMVLSGSGGGVNDAWAAFLASRGYAAFALAYFNHGKLPKELVEIPLEYFQQGMAWFAARPELGGCRIALMGGSRGGELALILGSLAGLGVSGIVARMPSNVVYGSVRAEPAAAPARESAWAWQGRPLAVAPFDNSWHAHATMPGEAVVLSPYFLRGRDMDPAAFAAAEIPVERIACPVLLIGCEDDAMWPSSHFCSWIIDRARRFGRQDHFRFLRLSDAGHIIRWPGIPTTVSVGVHPVDHVLFQYGGTPIGNAHAAERVLQETLDFLSTQLSRKS